jgi:hypothetical protein
MKYYPGNIVPQSGIYSEYSSSGIKVDQSTNVKGHPFPTAQSVGNFYMLYIAARHKTLER